MFERDYSEKRDFVRMYVEANVRFCKDGETSYHDGVTTDLSGAGLGFKTEECLNIGDLLFVTVSSGIAKVPPLEMEVRVVRVDATGDGHYLIGAERLK
ncbi:MAG: PilZ domain-containing protein [Gammaproteobacteria bacterium]|nr:MAG: PilZ domain-containing protein [Gammaproteobacteria bacterium]